MVQVRRVEVYSLQGAKPLNEDAFAVNPVARIYGVFDGATSVTDWHDAQGRTGGYLAAHLFRKHFEELTQPADLRCEILTANDALRQAMVAAQVDVADKTKLWCTCAAVVCVQPGQLAFAQLGDCMILGLRDDGSHQVYTKDTVEGISERARRHRLERVKAGEAMDLEAYVDPVRAALYNRTLANTPHGYTVANGTPEVKEGVQVGVIDPVGLEQLGIVSDGLFYPARRGPRADWNSTARFIRQHGMASYIAHVVSQERDLGIRPDDKTALVLHLI
ncbi:protein phosphatase 2C domain-containing protein [Alicyclobacillus macrosporangiidus]|uniref:Serine/threonine protein phosphatase PrpC n=1 Tax=Alicyclobacillus macrosporangiidus TaxID=392015 RepID=A0A1I7G9U3_9BACL|nr:protein phosphatase 2C domain-containing protein [Alicyclobacillus macrosporangiidus]SFU45101.1 Serine/threonine protein phosphatase PrpC [Alicyclobacillus macrosporangiidus]